MKAILLCATAFLDFAMAAASVVTKVEPPDWAAPQTATTLRVLLTGTNLATATGW